MTSCSSNATANLTFPCLPFNAILYLSTIGQSYYRQNRCRDSYLKYVSSVKNLNKPVTPDTCQFHEIIKPVLINVLFIKHNRESEDLLLFNHLMIILKQYICYCRNKALKPSFQVLSSKIDSIFQLESRIAKSRHKLGVNLMKWGKYILIVNTCSL